MVHHDASLDHHEFDGVLRLCFGSSYRHLEKDPEM